jgi:hypothetical protein
MKREKRKEKGVTLNSINIEKELVGIMAKEMMEQINKEVISDLLNLADPYRSLAKRGDFEFDEQDNSK